MKGAVWSVLSRKLASVYPYTVAPNKATPQAPGQTKRGEAAGRGLPGRGKAPRRAPQGLRDREKGRAARRAAPRVHERKALRAAGPASSRPAVLILLTIANTRERCTPLAADSAAAGPS